MYNFDPYNELFVYHYKYSCAAYDCFCAPGTHSSFGISTKYISDIYEGKQQK